MANYGIIGQLQGPFSSSDNIVNNIKAECYRVTGQVINPIFAKLGLSIAEKDHMIFTMGSDGESYPQSFKFIINVGDGNQEFWLGKTQIYESDDGLQVTYLNFPEGAPASILIDYVILNNA